MTPIPSTIAPKNRRSASKSNVAVLPSASQRLPKGPGPVAPKIKAGAPNRNNINRPLNPNKICKIIRFTLSSNHQPSTVFSRVVRSTLRAYLFGTERLRWLDANRHQPPYRPARHKAAHERQKLVKAADNLDYAAMVQRSQSRFHHLLRSKTR